MRQIHVPPLSLCCSLESRDADAPVATDNYGMSLAFTSFCFVSRTVQDVLEKVNLSKGTRGMKG